MTKLRFIDELNVDTNKNIPKKPHMLHLGLLMYRMYKAISSYVARCCKYVEYCKSMEQSDCFKIKGKVVLHQEEEQNG
jgi:hypothetical protein